jgi:hypothetical protein
MEAVLAGLSYSECMPRKAGIKKGVDARLSYAADNDGSVVLANSGSTT